jgi:hypothetical protein
MSAPSIVRSMDARLHNSTELRTEEAIELDINGHHFIVSLEYARALYDHLGFMIAACDRSLELQRQDLSARLARMRIERSGL